MSVRKLERESERASRGATRPFVASPLGARRGVKFALVERARGFRWPIGLGRRDQLVAPARTTSARANDLFVWPPSGLSKSKLARLKSWTPPGCGRLAHLPPARSARALKLPALASCGWTTLSERENLILSSDLGSCFMFAECVTGARPAPKTVRSRLAGRTCTQLAGRQCLNERSSDDGSQMSGSAKLAYFLSPRALTRPHAHKTRDGRAGGQFGASAARPSSWPRGREASRPLGQLGPLGPSPQLAGNALNLAPAPSRGAGPPHSRWMARLPAKCAGQLSAFCMRLTSGSPQVSWPARTTTATCTRRPRAARDCWARQLLSSFVVFALRLRPRPREAPLRPATLAPSSRSS